MNLKVEVEYEVLNFKYCTVKLKVKYTKCRKKFSDGSSIQTFWFVRFTEIIIVGVFIVIHSLHF